MSKKILVAAFVVAIATMSFAVFANGEYYDIGSNPMDSSRLPNPQTEAIVKLASDSPIVSMIGGGGAVATGKRLKAGELIVVDKSTHVAKWVARCGNEITTPTGWIPEGPVMDLQGATPAPAPTSTPAAAPAEQPAQQPAPPQQVDVNVNVHHDDEEQAPPQQTADYQQQSVVYSQEAQPGFWDMVGQSFVQALASGLGQGLACRLVWGGGGGYGYGGYGFFPVVYPSPAYCGGGGGGDVFVNKYITKTVYIDSGNTTITRGGGPRGGGPVNPPNPPGTGGGPVNPSNPGDSGSGSGGGPSNPSSLVRRGNIAGQGNKGILATNRQTGGRFQLETANGRRVPLTSQEVRANFPHGPTMGNGAWNPATRQYAPVVHGGGQLGTAPRQNVARGTQTPRGFAAPRATQPRQSAPQYSAPTYRQAPQYRAPAYRPPVYRQAAPRFSAPQYRAPAYHPAPAFRGGFHPAPAFRGGGFRR